MTYNTFPFIYIYIHAYTNSTVRNKGLAVGILDLFAVFIEKKWGTYHKAKKKYNFGIFFLESIKKKSFSCAKY